MKESLLSIKDGDGINSRKVRVKLTEENLIIQELNPSNHKSAITSTVIDSTNSSLSGNQFSRQATVSLSSTDSSRGQQSSEHNRAASKMPADNKRPGERVVTIKRQPGGGLGISVKGGAEHGIPVLISRVFPGQAADQTHLLHPGDAILAVNNKEVEHMMHDDVVAELRSCGPQVALTVYTFDGAGHVLRPPGGSTTTPSKLTSSPDQTHSQTKTFDSVDNSENSLNMEASTEITVHNDAIASYHDEAGKSLPAMNESTQLNSSTMQAFQEETLIPLLFSRLELYQGGTDKRRIGGFEVIGKDNTSSGILHCSSNEELSEWIAAVSKAIHQALSRKIMATDNNITYMAWISERYPMPASSTQNWSSRFIALRGDKLYLFNTPPEAEVDWRDCERVYTLYECLCRVHLPPRQLLDQREHCFSIQYSTNPPIYCSTQTKDELLRWENKVQKATHSAVYAIQTHSYECYFEDKKCSFLIHFNQGFKFIDCDNQEILWEYKFSQLRSSSDDGQSMITLFFNNRESGHTDKQSFSCRRAYPLLFSIHAFLAAKLSLVDPTFLEKINAQHTANDVTHSVMNGNNANGQSP